MKYGPSTSPKNGLMRCYNMFPSNFSCIDEMTEYLPELKKMGINVVWVNPLQLAGQSIHVKADSLTGQNQKLKGSLYAMTDHTLIDPRFSVVDRDADGDILLSATQDENVKYLKPINNKALKALRHSIQQLENKMAAYDKDLRKIQKNIEIKTQNNQDTSLFLQNQLNIEKKKQELSINLAQLKETYEKHLSVHQECTRILDEIALKEFTTKAKSLHITPIFDLVLNHAALDAAIVRQHPEFFNVEDRTFPDATAFIYSKLIGSRRSAPIEEAEREQILKLIPSIIEQFWQPFLRKYICDYGFHGVRVDCVRKIPYEVREPIYKIIQELIDASTKKSAEEPLDPVILEETLFSDLSAKEYVELVKGAGATHNTGSVYYKERQWHGGLSDDYSNEDYHKRLIVKNGVINFTGNHDHYTCAMTVCRVLAFERLQANKELYTAYSEEIFYKAALAKERGESLSDAAVEIIKTGYIHAYVDEIIAELEDPDNYNENVIRFGKAYRDTVLTNIFSGSGGYYILSGDEFASFNQPSVFLRENDLSVTPTQQLNLFTSEHASLAHSVLETMADDAIKRRKMGPSYEKLTTANQIRLRSGVVAQFKNEINSNVTNTKNCFKKILKNESEQGNLKIDQRLLENTTPIPNGYQNRWGAADSLQNFISTDFFSEVNAIVDHLPPSNKGFWSELFKAVDDDLLIAVRMNGIGYDADADIVIYNLNPYRTITVNKNDIHKIAMWFQKRGFGDVTEDLILSNPNYHKAYGCIMGAEQTHQKPANLYFGGNIIVEKCLAHHTVFLGGDRYGFNVTVPPKYIEPDPLFQAAPEEVVHEMHIPEQLTLLLNQFSPLTLRATEAATTSLLDDKQLLKGSSNKPQNF